VIEIVMQALEGGESVFGVGDSVLGVGCWVLGGERVAGEGILPLTSLLGSSEAGPQTKCPISNIQYLIPGILHAVEELHATLASEDVLKELAALAKLEAETYRAGNKSTYFADHLGIDVLTDTTERSPTFCTPAFRKWDDSNASESWSYLILPYPDSEAAWRGLLGREPYGLKWTDAEIESLVEAENADRQIRIMRQIGPDEILKFRIGVDGLDHRPIELGDLAVCVVHEAEAESLLKPDGFFRTQIERAASNGASTAVIFLGRAEGLGKVREFLDGWSACTRSVLVPLPASDEWRWTSGEGAEDRSPERAFEVLTPCGPPWQGGHSDVISRVAVKMLLNALSTTVMVLLGRVQGNCMVAVVPSNLKLIDRSTRYIQTLTGLSYEGACRLLFESIEHVATRMASGQAYPPPVELSVVRFERQCSLEEAEWRMGE
jgi:hypothetical protein